MDKNSYKGFACAFLPPEFRKVKQYKVASKATKAKNINKTLVSSNQHIVILFTRRERKDKVKYRNFDQLNQCSSCKIGPIITFDTH